ncbi:uncharacterized protein LOC128221526 [Mya arenaria]|uniref:uncharacterized protein LOC128221526 n=1 Tax=Mya arenaria TaxID=6604 RepID=UPI0022E11086|nr:uncharacterized protein LOC128221526 [Mya arenaria]
MAESIETRHENWLRVVWGLLYVREGLQGYVDTKGKQQYQTFMNTVNAKCNNQTCDQCQINIRCQNGTTKVTGKSKFRPAHFCDEMYKEIQNNHVRNNPFWMNTDSTKWLDPHVGYWELAKCYLSTAGYLDKTGSNQVDASGLLSICMNSSYMRQNITHIQHFEELRNIRNMTLHDPHYELDGQTADDCLDKMIAVLEDPQELIHDTFAKQAANQMRKIKFKTEKPPDIIHNKSLEEIESLMYNTIHKKLEVFVVDEVERKVKVEVKQEMQNYSDDRGNDKREHQVEDLRHRLAKYYQKHLNRAPISPLLSDKDERLDMFYVPPKMVEKDHRKIGVTEREQGTSVTAYRQLFCKMRVFRKSVFMVGEAGMGKSSCAAMCALKWANHFSSSNMINEPTSHQTPRNNITLPDFGLTNSDFAHIFRCETEQDEEFKDDSFFKEIEFLLHLTLRDSCDRCDLTDMIQDQLINKIYQQDERTAALSTMQSILSNSICVIIVDGLDEWTHPYDIKCSCSEEDKVIPHLTPTIDATVLITSRPWRMSQQRVKDTKIDTYMEKEGTTDMWLLIQKVLNSLNKTIAVKKKMPDFVKFVDRMNLARLLMVPILSMLLVCLWFEEMYESSSLCDIYAYTIEMMFGRKTLPVLNVSQVEIPFPRCFQHTEKVQKYCSIVIKMAHLAFTTLFSIDQTSALVFKKVDILSHENLLFVLKSGILQETKARSLLRKSSNYSFIHKTVQEFLAAIYMSYHPEEFHRVFLPFYQKNGDVSDISQVFVFMCGLNIKLANEMSALISDIPHHLLFRSDGSHRVIVSGYKEAKASQVLDIQLLLYDFYFRLETIDTGVLNDLLAMNKSKVRSISTSSETNQATLQEVFSNSTDTLTEVFIYDVAGKYDLSACNFLTSLSISGSKLTDIVVNTKNLFELNLKNVSKRVEYSIWQSIESESENLIKLKINCIKIIRIFRQTLPRLKQLHNLTIQSTELGELALLLPASVTNVHTVVNGDGGEAGKEHSNCEVSIIGVYCGSHREA